jgi:hypothetical protein
MPRQLDLRYDPRFLRAEVWNDFLELIQCSVSRIGLKQAAYDLDVQPSILSHALAERERHYLHLEWLHYFVTTDTDNSLVEHIAAWRGLNVSPRREITAEEWRIRVEGALAGMSPEFADVIKRKAGV